MQRRSFLAGAASLLTASFLASRSGSAQPPSGSRTIWKVSSSEGFDAIAFLGPLSGGELYTRYYRGEAETFGARLPAAIRADIPRLWSAASDEGFGLLGPSLQLLFSSDGNHSSLSTLVTALKERRERLLPEYRASQYWSQEDWDWLDRNAARLGAIFEAMEEARFPEFRRERIGELEKRVGEVERALARYDLIRLQEKLTGRRFEPTIHVVLLHFAKPHGIKVQGQRFLQSADYDTATTVRIAAHEMLHPPIDMKGSVARGALAILERDALIMKIVREHDPRWGYTTLEALLNEDLCQALDQLISEELGVARNPADRWRKSDDGIHVIAAGLYGLFRQDRWVETGGSIEDWLANAARAGRLAPGMLHPAAARVLERPVDRLWPLPSSSPAG